MISSRFNVAANRFVDIDTGRFISFETEAKIQLRLQRLERAFARARQGSLHSAGYAVATIAKGKIERSKKKSKPGDPPHTRRGLIRRAIRYEMASDRQSVVIGPVHSLVGTAGEAHEYGGRYKGQHYPKRPFMGPALEEAAPRLGPMYKFS